MLKWQQEDACTYLPKAIGHGLIQSFYFIPLLNSFGCLNLVCICAFEVPGSGQGRQGIGHYQPLPQGLSVGQGKATHKMFFDLGFHAVGSVGGGQGGALLIRAFSPGGF